MEHKESKIKIPYNTVTEILLLRSMTFLAC